jgi:hypothetical protein
VILRPPPDGYTDLLQRYPTTVRDIVAAARETIYSARPDIREETDAKAGLIGYGTAPGYKGTRCTLILSKKGVKLGLIGSATWPDPHHLLQGTGKVHRYLPLTAADSLDDPHAHELLVKALTP